MIEQQTINDRNAVVAYVTRDFEPATPSAFDYAKVLFEDGEMLLLSNDDGALDALAYGRHRHKHRRPISDDSEGMAEAAGFSKHRMKHLLAVSPVVMTAEDLPEVEIEGGAEGSVGNAADISVKLQLVAWQKAVIVIDASEVLVRDLIERELAGMTGPAAEYRPKRSQDAIDALVAKIADIRVSAIKTAFRLLRDRFNNAAVLDTSLAKWAAYFAQMDVRAIDAAIRAGLVKGLDNIEIARTVVGSMALNGVDGVTEYTRNKIAHLGRASIRAYNQRKFGETQGAFDHTRIN